MSYIFGYTQQESLKLIRTIHVIRFSEKTTNIHLRSLLNDIPIDAKIIHIDDSYDDNSILIKFESENTEQ